MSEYITTYTGLHFRPTEPDSDLIRIQDIAHALSLICRGNGHVQTFWSVGEHCICCAKEAAARGFSKRVRVKSQDEIDSEAMGYLVSRERNK